MRRIELNRAAMLVLLLAFSSFAQEAPQQSEPSQNPCVWNSRATSTEVDRPMSQSGKAQVDLFRLEARPGKSKCNYLSLAIANKFPGAKPINNESSDRVQRGKLVGGEKVGY